MCPLRFGAVDAKFADGRVDAALFPVATFVSPFGFNRRNLRRMNLLFSQSHPLRNLV